MGELNASPRALVMVVALVAGIVVLLTLLHLFERRSDPLLAAVEPLIERSKGDLDQMLKRRQIRALVPYSPTFYFLDENSSPRGFSHAFVQAFEQHLNAQLDPDEMRISVVPLPVTRDRLIPWLRRGYGDLIVADLSVTDARKRRVLFTDPFASGVDELLLSGPEAAPIESLQQLSGRSVLVRENSSYDDSLKRLNRDLNREGLPAVDIQLAAAYLETDEVLMRLNAGQAEHSVAHAHLARFWAEQLPNINVHDSLVLRQDVALAFAVRPGSRKLKTELDEFLETHRLGTLFGNVTLERFIDDSRWLARRAGPTARPRFGGLADLFQRYAEQYQLDWRLLAAQGYHESKFNSGRRSPAGALGVMQILPTTAAEMDVGNVLEPEPNIHAAAKYLRFMIDRYFSEADIEATDRLLLALAAYNAGPRRVQQMRRAAENEGLDPDRWFNHVERIAAREIGRETIDYVQNVFDYYLIYTLIDARDRLIEAKQAHAVDG